MPLGGSLPTKLPESDGNTYFYSTTGSDTTGDGSVLNPYRTLTKALQVKGTEAGCKIHSRGGTYDENVNVANCHGTSTDPITIEPHEDEPVTHRKVAAAGSNFPLTANAWSYMRIRGLVMDGMDVNNSGVEDADLYFTGSSHDIDIEDIEIKNSYEQGILSDDGCVRLWVDRVYVHDGGQAAGSGARDHAIYMQGDDNLLTNSLIGDWTNGHCVQIFPRADGMIIANNTIYHTDFVSGSYHSAAILIGSGPSGSDPGPSDNHIIVNNLIYSAAEGIVGYNANGPVKSLAGGITLPANPIALNNVTSLDTTDGQILIADVNNDALQDNGLVAYTGVSSPNLTGCTTLHGSGSSWANGELVIASNIDYVAGTGTVAHHNGIFSITYIKRRCNAQAGALPIIDFQGSDVFSDPLVVDDDGRNYHLQYGSPLYNAGVAAYCPAYDKDGRARLVPTIGAFAAPEEFVAPRHWEFRYSG